MSMSKEHMGRDEFREIDTSKVGAVPNLLTALDIADIISEEQSISNPDYMNNNNFDHSFKNNVLNSEFPNINVEDFRSNNCYSAAVNDGLGAKKTYFEAFEGRIGQCIPYDGKCSVVEIECESNYIKKRYPCIVCKKKFVAKSEMKHHVRSTHLRQVVLCNICGKRMFHDKLLNHEKVFHSKN